MTWENEKTSQLGWGGLGKRRLSWQQPIVSKKTERIVVSWDGLVDALGAYALQTQESVTGGSQAAGNLIKFGCPFIWKETVTIPAECIGLTIDGSGFHMTPATANMTMFTCAVNEVKFKNIYAYHLTGTVLLAWGTMFNIGTCSEVRIIDCAIAGTRLVEAAAMSNSWITDCRGLSFVNANTWVNMAGGTRNSIRGNVFASTNNQAIVLGALESRCTINGNRMSGNGIITSASGGLNSIAGNTNAGTLTAHATDNTTGGNT